MTTPPRLIASFTGILKMGGPQTRLKSSRQEGPIRLAGACLVRELFASAVSKALSIL